MEKTVMMIKAVKNKQKKCYENNIERLQEPTRKKYRELSNEKNDIKRECARNRYRNIDGR